MSVYFDHNATTPLDARVLDAMMPYLKEHYGNASSRHEHGRHARKALDEAREKIAAAVNAHPSQVILVSGGSEANNLAIKGAAGCLKPSQVLISAVEHPCVAKSARELGASGWRVRTLVVDAEGRVEADDLTAALREPTALVSVMLANNETGVLQDLRGVAQQARAAGAWVHTDAVQAVGKIAVDFDALGVHALSFSAHKMHGPKGAAALIVDKRLELRPQIVGGLHEKGLRAGTENVAAIVGFGAACELAVQRLQRTTELRGLRERLEAGLEEMGAEVFGAAAERLPNTSYFAFPGVDGETLVMALDRAGFAVASGSACSSGNADPSSTLLAMGVPADLARGALRVSFGRDNSLEQVDAFLATLSGELSRFTRMAALAV
ncbi:MAG: cysteine desulfurase family protein [Burkholderiales bacterium]